MNNRVHAFKTTKKNSLKDCYRYAKLYAQKIKNNPKEPFNFAYVTTQVQAKLDSSDLTSQSVANICNTIKLTLKHLSSKDFSKTFWSLAVLNIEWKKIDADGKLLLFIKKYISDNIHNFDPVGLIQLRQADLNFHWNLDPSIIVHIEKNGKEALNTKESFLERRFCQSLQSILEGNSIKFSKEIIIEHFKHVDILFLEQKIILEIDGNFHYDEEGELRPKDKLNHRLLETLGYQVHRISESTWKSLDKKGQTDFLIQELQQLRILPSTTINKNVSAKNSQFFQSSNSSAINTTAGKNKNSMSRKVNSSI